LLTTRDHATCGVFAMLMYLALKLALTPTFFSLFGWIVLYWNWKSFEIYCQKRKSGEI